MKLQKLLCSVLTVLPKLLSIIGKPYSYLLGSTSNITIIPPEIAAIVSLKYKFVVTYSDESSWGREKVFLIKSIVAAYGRNNSLTQIQENVTPKKI
jgi:hypothetical protein